MKIKKLQKQNEAKLIKDYREKIIKIINDNNLETEAKIHSVDGLLFEFMRLSIIISKMRRI